MSGHRPQLRLSTSFYKLEFQSVWLKKRLMRANKIRQKRSILSKLWGRVYLFWVYTLWFFERGKVFNALLPGGIRCNCKKNSSCY